MRKLIGLSAVGLAAGAVCVAAWAATLTNVSGQSCGDFLGNWHFVNTQSGGGTSPLYVCFTSGCISVQASKVLNSTTHYNVSASGTLLNGSNNNPGKVVLSDFTCEDKKECDPNTDKTCK